MKLSKLNSGFTFIEVLVAMFIFTMAVVASLGLNQGSVRATREAKTLSTATWLLQNVMVELETKLETEGIEKGCEKKKEGKFEPPFNNFTWATYCQQIDFQLSQTAAAMLSGDENKSESEQSQENMIQKMVLENASGYLSKATRELHAEVIWMEGKEPRTIDVTTHFAKYDEPFVFSPFNPGGS